MFRTVIILIVSLFAVHISGCGHDEAEIQEDLTTNLLQVTPSIGSQLKSSDPIVLTFDSIPTRVASTAGVVAVSGKTVMIHGPFLPGGLNLTVTWEGGSKELNFRVPVGPKKDTKSLDAIEVDDIQPREGVPAKFVRSEPLEGYSVFGVDPVVLYFDNRPTHVKITGDLEDIDRAVVRGNTVEVFIDQPPIGPLVGFTVTWSDGKKGLIFGTNQDANTPPDVLKVIPPDGSSIVGVDTIRLFFTLRPTDAKYFNHASESFGEVTTVTNMVEFDLPHPIKEPSISFTVSWTGKDELERKSKKLTYTNEDVEPEE